MILPDCTYCSRVTFLLRFRLWKWTGFLWREESCATPPHPDICGKKRKKCLWSEPKYLAPVPERLLVTERKMGTSPV